MTSKQKPYDTTLTQSMKPRKSKKALTLAERIAVIQMYPNVRNTRKLAGIFGCGRTQIQNILRRKDEYFTEWQRNGDPNQIRCRQPTHLVAIGAVVYEWVERSLAHGLELNEELVRKTAQTVAKVINIPEFHATNSWIDRFKKKYKLHNFRPKNVELDIAALRNKSLKIDDIIHDLIETRPLLFLPRNLCYEALTNENDEVSNDGNKMVTECKDENFEENSGNSQNPEILDGNIMEILEIIKSETDDCISLSSNESEDLQMQQDIPNCANITQEEESFHLEIQQDVQMDQKSCTPSVKPITTYKEALDQLGPLEQFALLQEDIRATGLINQLENLFKEKILSL